MMSSSAGSPPVAKIASVAFVVSRPGRSAYGALASTRSLAAPLPGILGVALTEAIQVHGVIAQQEIAI
jgi:hypothetical protein